jgi:hypothetical protein
MIDADDAGHGDRQRCKKREVARPRIGCGAGKGEQCEQDRRAVRPTLPVTHLARVKPADVLERKRSTEKRCGDD